MVLLPCLRCQDNFELCFSFECLYHRDFVLPNFHFSYTPMLDMDIPNMVYLDLF